MPLPVPNEMAQQPMTAVRVARPVSTATGQAPQQIMSLLHGRCKAILGSNAGLPLANGDVRWTYKHEPAARVLKVELRLNVGTTTAARATIATSLNGSTTKLAGTTDEQDGTVALGCPTTRIRVPSRHVCYFDTSGLTVGSLYDLLVTTGTSAGTPQGIYSLSAETLPRDVLDPENNPSTDQGIQFAFPRGDNPIFAGSATTAADAGGGTERYIYELDQWRAKSVRYPLQIATVENDTYSWNTTSATFANLTGIGTAAFNARVTRFYTTSVKGAYKARCRYKVTGGGNAVLRITSTSVAAGTTDNNDSATLTSAAYAWSDPWAVSMATDGTLQETVLTVQGKTTAGTFYVDSIVVYPNES